MAASDSEDASSSAATEPLPPSDTEVLQSVGRGRRAPRSDGKVSTLTGARDALGRARTLNDGDNGDEDEPLPKDYGHTRPIKELKARRRTAGSESSLTSQSDSDSTDRPIASSSLKVPSRRAGLRKATSVVNAAELSDLSDASEGDERKSTSPEIYRPRPGSTSKSRRRRPLPVETGHFADESEISALPTPGSPPTTAATATVNGRKRRRADDPPLPRSLKASGRADKKKRTVSPTVSRGKLKALDVKIEEALPAEEDTPIDEEPEEVEAEDGDVDLAPEQPEAELPAEGPVDIALDVEPEPESEREEDPANAALNRARLDAMEELVRIEIRFAKVREALYLERSEANLKERQTIEDGSHVDLHQFSNFLDEKQTSRLKLARQMYDNTERMIEHQAGVEERTAWRWWENANLTLRTDLLLQTQRKRRRHDRDRTFGSKWDKAEETDKYREIYEDHMRRRALTEEVAEAEYTAETESRWMANGVSPLSAAAIQTDLEAMSIRSPKPLPAATAPVAAYASPMFANQPSLGPYQQMGPGRMSSLNLPISSAPASYITAASIPPAPYVPPPRTMPSPLTAPAFQQGGALSRIDTGGQQQYPEGGLGQARTIHSPPVASPISPSSAGGHKPGHAHRPSLDAHMERKSTPNSFQSRFVLPPIPPFAGGTKTHSGMLASANSASTSAPATPTMPSASVPPPLATTSGPSTSAGAAVQQHQQPKSTAAIPEIPPFRFPPNGPTPTAVGGSS